MASAGAFTGNGLPPEPRAVLDVVPLRVQLTPVLGLGLAWVSRWLPSWVQ